MFVEVESGKHDADRRPVLAKALAGAKRDRAPILVAKLDRLSHDVHYISGLIKHNVPFIVAEFGVDTDPFMLHIDAEGEAHVQRAHARYALRAAKARGVALRSAFEAGMLHRVSSSAAALDHPVFRFGGARKTCGLGLEAVERRLGQAHCQVCRRDPARHAAP